MFIGGKRLFLFHMISFYYGNMVIFLRSCSFFFKYIYIFMSEFDHSQEKGGRIFEAFTSDLPSLHEVCPSLQTGLLPH